MKPRYSLTEGNESTEQHNLLPARWSAFAWARSLPAEICAACSRGKWACRTSFNFEWKLSLLLFPQPIVSFFWDMRKQLEFFMVSCFEGKTWYLRRTQLQKTAGKICKTETFWLCTPYFSTCCNDISLGQASRRNISSRKQLLLLYECTAQTFLANAGLTNYKLDMANLIRGNRITIIRL